MAKGKSKAAQAAGGSPGTSPPTTGPKMSLFPLRPQRKPNETPPGQVVELMTNFFAMSIKQKKTIYRYAINIDVEPDEEGKTQGPSKLSNDLRCEVLEKALETWYQRRGKKQDSFYYVYDSNGSTMYALFEADSTQPELRVKLDRSNENLTFRVKLLGGQPLELQKLVSFCAGEKSTDITLIQEQIRAINFIMRAKLRTIATNIMSPTCVYPYLPSNQAEISPGVSLNKGYYLSARPTQGGLVLNVANTSAAFYQPLFLTDFVRKRYRVDNYNQPLVDKVLQQLKQELKNKQIEATHINYGDVKSPHYRKYRVNDIAGSSLDKFNLVDKESGEVNEVTIQSYFMSEYKVKLKFPKLPCVVDTRGRKIPMELCRIVEKQKVSRRMDPEETAQIIKMTAMKPDVHFNQLRDSVQQIDAAKKPLIDFGLDFYPAPIRVNGRELPSLQMHGASKTMPTRDGQYDASDRFVRGAAISIWEMVFLVDFDVKRNLKGPAHLVEMGKEFSNLYTNAARNKGMNVKPIANVRYMDCKPNEREMKKDLLARFQDMNRSKVDHCIFVLPDKCQDWIYRYLQYLEGTVKTRPANENCTRISCLKFSNFLRKIIQDRAPNPQQRGRMFIGNLLYKYNSKMGGVNFVLADDRSSFLRDGYIFISIDVCHPAPGDKLIQSVAAVVGMWDLTNPNMSTCTAQRVQKKMRENHSTIEEVGEVGEMVDQILSSYQAKKKKLPTYIILLRDGVSEGQFRIVLEKELSKVKAVVSRRYGTMKPPLLSCFVVQKRHRTRLRRIEGVKNYKGIIDYNIQPGTVVDSKIVHPTDHDFYIAPHKAIQGTSQPLHVYAIYDEIKLTQEEAQGIVFKLSHLSPRCNKGTSIPTTVNLADLAAERGKNIVISWNSDNLNRKLNEEEILKELNKLLANLGDANYKNTLYYV